MQKLKKIVFNEIHDKNKWERLLAKHPEANFLQSWNWGAFKQDMGKKVWRFEVVKVGGEKNANSQNKTKHLGIIGFVKEPAKRGNYLTIAGGPIIGWDKLSLDELRLILQNLKELAKKQDCLFVRFRPQAIASEKLASNLKKLGTIPSPMHLTADLTLQLDLTKDLETILKEMRKSTRYEIRQIEKKGVTTKITTDEKEIKDFYDQQIILAKRHNFVPFSFNFLQKQFINFLSDQQVALIHSFKGEDLLASAFVIFYHGEAIYHYGISTEKNYRLPGSYACQWAAIAEAKKRGCNKYNFWGIAPKELKSHRFAGVSTFKRGFGGEEVQYLPARDLPVSPWYWVVWAFEMLRKKSRGL